MVRPPVNGLGGWNVLGQPLRHQFGEGPRALKDPPQFIGDLPYGNDLLFYYTSSGASLHWNRTVYPPICHPHRLWGWRPGGFGSRPTIYILRPLTGKIAGYFEYGKNF